MNLQTLTDQELMAFAGARFASHRVTPNDAAQFLVREILRAGLRRFQGHRMRTANWLGISKSQLDRHMKQLGVSSLEYHQRRSRRRRKKLPQSVPLAEQEMRA